MRWDVVYRHVEYPCKLGLRSYVDSLWVVVGNALPCIMLIILVMFSVGKGKAKEC